MNPEPRIVTSAENSTSGHSITSDETSFGGASHRYSVRWENEHYVGSNGIHFQTGPVKEHGHNGVTAEDLLEIVADRLFCFQAGPFACDENAEALSHVASALAAMNSRTAKRRDRGVEGTTAK